MHRTLIEKMMKRSVFIRALTLALMVVFATACSKNTNNSSSSNDTGSSSKSSSNTASNSSTANTTSTTTRMGGDTPIGALEAYYDAAKRKDIEGIKKYLSHGTMQWMENIAKTQNKSVDQLLQEGADRDVQMTKPEFTNEKISGDTATVEIKPPDRPAVTMQMVKEDGIWKLAVDKMMPGTSKSPG